MTASAGPSLDSLKRRQAVQVALFLLGVTVATAITFQFVRGDLIAYRRGESAFASRNFAEATAQLELASKKGYRSPRLRLDLAQSYLETGRRDEALVHYSAALKDAPTNESLLDTVAGLYQSKGEPEKGRELFARLGPRAQLPLASLVRLGDLEQQAGNYAGAIEVYRVAVQRAPDEPEIRVRLGIVLSWVGERGEAIESFQRALAVQPNHRLAQLYLARVLMWDGRFAEAVAGFRHVFPP